MLELRLGNDTYDSGAGDTGGVGGEDTASANFAAVIFWAAGGGGGSRIVDSLDNVRNGNWDATRFVSSARSSSLNLIRRGIDGWYLLDVVSASAWAAAFDVAWAWAAAALAA